jgi:predicted transcriptional regulator
MNKQPKNPLENVYKKTFKNELNLFLQEQIPSLGNLTSKVIVDEIQKKIDAYFPPLEHFRMGQILWPAVDINEKASYGKTIEKTKLVPVQLDLIHTDDIEAFIKGKKAKDIRKQIMARLFKQAPKQNGVIGNADAALMLKVNPATISRYIKEWENENKEVLPRRGVVHDLGPATTHKKEICYHVLVEGMSIEDTARLTNHSPEAVTRYVRDFKRVHTCLKQGLSARQTKYILNISSKLTEEYIGLIKKHNLDYEKFLQEEELPF